MRVLLILADMPSRSPYLVYYTEIFERCGVEYDVCCWNQRGENYKLPDNYFVYDTQCRLGIVSRLRGYNQYRHFVLRHGFKKYDRIVVFTVAIACFLGRELVKDFRRRYIFDIRDKTVHDLFLWEEDLEDKYNLHVIERNLAISFYFLCQ